MITTGIHLISNDNFVISAIESREDSLIVLGHQKQIFKGIKKSGLVHYADVTDIFKVKGDMPTNTSPLPPLLQYQSTYKHISAKRIFKVLILCFCVQTEYWSWLTICLNFYVNLKFRKPISGIF